jgi:alkylation response protein AidB-like acyl-CoA dehydrogenase
MEVVNTPVQHSLINTVPVHEETRNWLAAVDRIAPVLEKFRQDAEDQRSAPLPVFEVLRDAGIHRMFVSRPLGGAQVSLQTGSAVLQALAALDPSVAWQMGVQGAIGRLSDYLPESVARRLFKDQSSLVVGSVNPTGYAEVVESGYRLTGRWGFASGSAHAAWLVCAAFVTKDGRRLTTDAGPEIRMLFVPKSRVQMLDTWHTVGLRGTGSEDYLIDEPDGVFVPEEFTVRQSDMFAAPPERPSLGYPVSYYDFGLFGSGSTVLGIARGALDAFKAFARSKVPSAGSQSLADSHTVQEQVARAEALVRSARLLLADAAWHATEQGRDGGDSLSATVRLSAASVADSSCAAVDILFDLAGTTSLYAGNLLERYFRDVHTAAKHITVSRTNFEMAGQYLLGGPLQMRR